MHAHEILDELLEADTPPDSQAFLGFKANPKGGFAVRVCSWCPDARQVREWAKKQSMPCTDGICVQHYKAMLAAQGLD